jgi:hypothetical protein
LAGEQDRRRSCKTDDTYDDDDDDDDDDYDNFLTLQDLTSSK